MNQSVECVFAHVEAKAGIFEVQSSTSLL